MANKVKGKQLYMFMGSGESLTPIGCSTDCSAELRAEAIETTGAGDWACFRSGRKAWSMSCSGFYLEESEHPTNFIAGSQAIGQSVIVALTVLARDLVEAGVDLSKIAPSAEHTIVGSAIITACRYAGSVGGLATYAIEYTGSGPLQLI